jgi:hypothetical protein
LAFQAGQIPLKTTAQVIKDANLCSIMEVFGDMPTDETGASRNQDTHTEMKQLCFTLTEHFSTSAFAARQQCAPKRKRIKANALWTRIMALVLLTSQFIARQKPQNKMKNLAHVFRPDLVVTFRAMVRQSSIIVSAINCTLSGTRDRLVSLRQKLGENRKISNGI